MTRVLYKEYIFDNQWLERREALKQKATRSEYDGTYHYVWALWTKQKGKDALVRGIDGKPCVLKGASMV